MGITNLRAWLLAGVTLASGVCSCSSSPSSSSNPPSACANIAIDRFKELTVVDPGAMTDARALNANDGAWSFRHAVENMAPEGVDPGQFVLRWFNEWATSSSVSGFAIPDAPAASAGSSTSALAAGMNTFVLCPWMRSTPSNGCNDDCSACTAKPATLDLAKAPFRLLAIVNRMDLREQLGTSVYGEGRLVFGLTNGPADDTASVAQAMTLIFEYDLPPQNKTLVQWASSWHALGSYAAFNEDFNAALQAVTDTFVVRGAMPSRPNGSALSQARTNESALFWVWQMRQFEIGSDGQMHGAAVRNTPDPGSSGDGSSTLVQYLQANSLAIQANTYLIPSDLLSGSADELLYQWNVPNIDPQTSVAFAKGTCNGCHSEGLNPSIDTAFHISPFRTGIAKLSTFENNPEDPTHDDLASRAVLLQDALCGN